MRCNSFPHYPSKHGVPPCGIPTTAKSAEVPPAPPLIFLDKETPPILRTAFLLYIILLFHYHLYLFFYRYMPLPVADLFEVLTVLSDVLFVLDEFVVHLLDQVSTLETVNLVLYTHIEWSCNGTLLLIAVNGHVVVVTLIGQLVDQSRISVECEDDRFIFCTISEQVRDFA